MSRFQFLRLVVKTMGVRRARVLLRGRTRAQVIGLLFIGEISWQS